MRSVPVYVASKFEQKPLVRQVMAALKAAGHTITADWTIHDATGKSGRELTQYLAMCAEEDANGVAACEVLLLLDHAAAKATYTELGIAVGLDKKIIVVGGVKGSYGYQNIFMHLPEVAHLETPGDAVDAINLYAALTPPVPMERYVVRPNMPEARA